MFDDMIADMESNEKQVLQTVTELFLRKSKLNIPLVFLSQSYFKVSKTIRLNATQYFIMKIRNVSKYKFLTGKNVLPEKDLLENAATMKRFKYSPLGKEFKAETDIAKKPYQKLDDTFGGR